MKFKLKELNFNNISLNKTILENGTIINLKYSNELLEFQTPRIIINDLIKEKDKEYLVLKIIGNQACKTFCSKINELETYFSESLKKPIKTIFNEDLFTVKIPFRSSNPLIKVYKDNSLFNYYHLSKDMEIICLLGVDKIWINNYNEPSYHLIVKEIMVM